MSTAAQSEPLVAIPGGYYTDASHTYFNESKVERPSVTQILAWSGFVDYDHVKPDVLEHKRDLGDAAHFACHILARGDELDWETVHDEVVPYVLAFESFLAQEKFVVDVVAGKPQTEIRGLHKTHGMEYGFQFDLRGQMGGFPCVVDLKCTYGVEDSWQYQLAAYEMTQPRPKGSPTYGRLVVQLKPDGTYKLHPFNDKRDADCFLWCLGITFRKLNHGMTWRKKDNNGR